MDFKLWMSLLLALVSCALFLSTLSAPSSLQLAPAAVLSALTGMVASPLVRARASLMARADRTQPEPTPAAAAVRAAPAPASTAAPATSALEQLLEQMGERYLADLRQLHDAFEQLYAPQLTAKEAELSHLRDQVAQLERERDQLRARVQQQDQRRDRLIADVQAMRDELSGRLAAVVQTLDPVTSPANPSHDIRATVPASPVAPAPASVPAGPVAPASPATAPPPTSVSPSPNRPAVSSKRRTRR